MAWGCSKFFFFNNLKSKIEEEGMFKVDDISPCMTEKASVNVKTMERLRAIASAKSLLVKAHSSRTIKAPLNPPAPLCQTVYGFDVPQSQLSQ